jgi:hypothetical protein
MKPKKAYLGEKEHASGKNESPDKLNTGGNSPCTHVWAVLGGIVDDSGKKDTNSDSPLIQAYNSTTNPFG